MYNQNAPFRRPGAGVSEAGVGPEELEGRARERGGKAGLPVGVRGPVGVKS